MQLTTTRANHACRSGFTIVEILVVIALVLVLLSLVVVAVGSATRTAQRTNTVALMNSINQGLSHFREDMGYLPPVLDRQRNIRWTQFGNGDGRMNGPDPNSSAFQDQIQDWYSVTSLAEYLIGYGGIDEDGHDGPGIRRPGTDGFWGATVDHSSIKGTRGTFTYRSNFLESDLGRSYLQGRVYGPYLQLRDDRMLGAINPAQEPDEHGNYQVFFPGEAGYDPIWPKVIVDYWGEPIRYYRRPYPQGGIERGYRAVRQADDTRMVVPTLADVFALRPWTVSGDEVDARFSDRTQLPQGGVDRTATYALQQAEFGLLSSGPDRRINKWHRVDAIDFGADTDGVNEDNIVELGQ